MDCFIVWLVKLIIIYRFSPEMSEGPYDVTEMSWLTGSYNICYCIICKRTRLLCSASQGTEDGNEGDLDTDPSMRPKPGKDSHYWCLSSQNNFMARTRTVE